MVSLRRWNASCRCAPSARARLCGWCPPSREIFFRTMADWRVPRLITGGMKISRLIAGFLFVCAGLSVHAAPAKFDLPALPAAAGLIQFARQAGVELLFSHADVQAYRTNAVAGEHEPEAALEILLKDTGLTGKRVAEGKFVVTLAPHGRVSGQVLS